MDLCDVKPSTRNMVLLRGASGSGKTTFANLLVESNKCNEMSMVHQISADQYFMEYYEGIEVHNEQIYKFDPAELQNAHTFCLMCTEFYINSMTEWTEHVEHDVDHTLFIHNTFTKEWEMAPYIELAKKYDYRVTTIVIENRHESDSVHDVPTEVVQRQKERFEIKL